MSNTEPIGTAVVEVRADLSRLDADGRAIEDRLRRALAPPDVGDDYHRIAERMRTELGVGADRAGTAVESAFRDAATDSNVQLDKIGGPGTFDDVKRESATAGDSIKRNLKNAADESEGHFNRISGAGRTMFGLLAGAAATFGGIALFKGAISQASDLNESINAVNVTFGDNAAGIQALAESASGNLGLTQTEFNAVAVSFGNFATTIAGPGGDVAKTMGDLTGRASDFASVMNLDVNTANDLFRSGLSGESEPLRKYGIDISEASVKTFAYANGIANSGDELTEAQKVNARYGLIMAQTNKVQGDFANTSGDLANGMRVLRANALETAASFGSAFLPALKGVVSGLNTTVQGLADPLASLGTSIGGALQPLMDAIGPALGIAISQLSVVMGDVGTIIGVLAPLLSPIVQIVGVLATALSGTLATAFKALQPAINIVAKFLDVFADHLGGALFDALDAITPALITIGDLLGGAFEQFLPVVLQMFDDLTPILIAIAQVLTDSLLAALPGLIAAFQQVAEVLLPLVPILADGILIALQTLQPILPILIDAFIAWKVVQLILNIAMAAFNVILEANPVTLVAIAVAALVVGVIQAYQHFQIFHDIVDSAWQIMQSVWDFITNFFVAAWHDLQVAVDFVTAAVQAIWDKTEGLRGFLSAVFSVAIDLYFKIPFDLVRAAIQLTIDIIQLVWDKSEGFRGFLASAFSTGVGLAKLALGFMRDMLGFVADKASFLWDVVLQPLLNFLGGAFSTGINTAKSVLEGIRDAFQWVIDKVEALIGWIGKIHFPEPPGWVKDIAGGVGNVIGAVNPFNAEGGIFTRATLGVFGEAGKEAIIPTTRPGRAMQLMAESGLGQMWDASRGPGGGGPIVHIEHATFADATDADLVAQTSYAAVSAKMLAAA